MDRTISPGLGRFVVEAIRRLRMKRLIPRTDRHNRADDVRDAEDESRRRRGVRESTHQRYTRDISQRSGIRERIRLFSFATGR